MYATDQSPAMLRVARERVSELGLTKIAFVAAVKGHASHDGSVKLTGDTIIVAGTK